MTLENSGNRKINPLRDLVALKWIPPRKTKSGILIPESYFSFGLRLGQLYVCEVLAIGPKAHDIKPKDKVLLHEYSLKDFPGTWKEDEIYFTEFKNIKAKVTGIKGLIHRVVSKTEEQAIEKTL